MTKRLKRSIFVCLIPFLNLELRSVLGKKVKHLVRDGQIPAVIHDHGKPSIVVQGKILEVQKAYQQAGRHHTVNLTAGDQTYTALIRKVDIDPKKNVLRHVVFNAVKADEKVEADIPIHPRYLEGNESSPAERSGLLVLSNLDSVEVEAIPSLLPDFIEYDAEKLVEAGDSVTVADLIVPKGVEIKEDPNHAIATVYEPSALEAANNDAGGTAEQEALSAETDETAATEDAAAESQPEKSEDN